MESAITKLFCEVGTVIKQYEAYIRLLSLSFGPFDFILSCNLLADMDLLINFYLCGYSTAHEKKTTDEQGATTRPTRLTMETLVLRTSR